MQYYEMEYDTRQLPALVEFHSCTLGKVLGRAFEALMRFPHLVLPHNLYDLQSPPIIAQKP